WVAATPTTSFTGINPGTLVDPALRIIDGSGTEVCIQFLNRFETPFIVEGLIVNPVANPSDCTTGLSVTV
ncbi:hypothetical protein, partial [Tenacibaculum sp. L6]|uniref:hypothetical protein n=1 Tax=Tenacibaculum sp. L6 TaxID=2992764 RepID=UPI00237B5822